MGAFTHAPRGLWAAAQETPAEPARGAAQHAEQRQAGDRRHREMHAVAQRIADFKEPRQAMRQRVDDGDFEAEPRVADRRRRSRRSR